MPAPYETSPQADELGAPEVMEQPTTALPDEEQARLIAERWAPVNALCDEQGQWRPGLTREEIVARNIPRPGYDHPLFLDPRYHVGNDLAQPLNRRGWNELDHMDYSWARVSGRDRMLVHPRDEEANRIYNQELRNLDALGVDAATATEYLNRFSDDPKDWDEWLEKGLSGAGDHKLAAYILIARGLDTRPLGQVFHDIRRRAPDTYRGKIAVQAVQKASAAARWSDPNATKPHYFG